MRDEPYELTADALEYDATRKLYVARGDVKIVQGERTLRADWISFNAETGNGVASGDVELVDGGDLLRAAFVEFDINNLEGVLYRAHFESDASRFVAEGDGASGPRRPTSRSRDTAPPAIPRWRCSGFRPSGCRG
jgi:LPS-assembly protein